MSENRKPGRLPKGTRSDSGLTQAQAATNPGVESGSREDKAHGITRHNRISMGGASQTMAIPVGIKERLEREGKHPHWILDNDRGNLQAAKNAGYEHVADDRGSNIVRNAGGRSQYLMSLPQEYYKEDKLLKKQRAAANLGQEADLGDGEYSPTGQDSAVSSKVSDNMYTS